MVWLGSRFQTGNLSITLQKWSCKVWSYPKQIGTPLWKGSITGNICVSNVNSSPNSKDYSNVILSVSTLAMLSPCKLTRMQTEGDSSLTAASIFCYCSSDTLPCSTSRQDLACNSSTHSWEGESLPLRYNSCSKLRRGIKKGQAVSSCHWEHCTLNIETLLSCQDQYAFPSSPLIHTKTQKSMTSNEYMRSSRTIVSRGTIKSICVARSLELWETWGPRHPQ